MRKKSNQAIVILAAGKGTRMKSDLPKVLHPFGGQPMICHILDRIYETHKEANIAIVVGYAKDLVISEIKKNLKLSEMSITFIEQKEQLGTGHAAKVAMDSAWGKEAKKQKSQILVLPGDLPLVSNELVRDMLEPMPSTVAIRLLTTTLSDPTGYGRVIRRGKTGPVLRIAEEKDAKGVERDIQEVAVSIYTFQAAFLSAGLDRLSPKNAQKEYYLTDLIGLSHRQKKKIEVLHWLRSDELRGINTPWELSLGLKLLNRRILKRYSENGVRFLDLDSVWVDDTVVLEENVEIHPGCHILGGTEIRSGSVILPNVVLKNVKIGKNCLIKVGTVAEDSVVDAESCVGPYAHLRPGSHVGKFCKIGNFVELKESRVSDHTSIAHLSYVGDAKIGKNVNIGCGFVTCNFDGRVIEGKRKHQTIIEDDVFLGSDCQTVAPVKIGKGAYVASGSTITEDVEAGSLAIARCRQTEKKGYAEKLRPKK